MTLFFKSLARVIYFTRLPIAAESKTKTTLYAPKPCAIFTIVIGVLNKVPITLSIIRFFNTSAFNIFSFFFPKCLVGVNSATDCASPDNDTK